MRFLQLATEIGEDNMQAHTKKGFAIELTSAVILDILTGIILITYAIFHSEPTAEDYFMAFFPPLIGYLCVIRLIRYAFVFRAYVVLYSIYPFFLIVLLLIGMDVAQDLSQGPEFGFGEIYFIVLLAGVVFYSLWIYALRRKGLFKKNVTTGENTEATLYIDSKAASYLSFPGQIHKISGDGG